VAHPLGERATVAGREGGALADDHDVEPVDQGTEHRPGRRPGVGDEDEPAGVDPGRERRREPEVGAGDDDGPRLRPRERGHEVEQDRGRARRLDRAAPPDGAVRQERGERRGCGQPRPVPAELDPGDDGGGGRGLRVERDGLRGCGGGAGGQGGRGGRCWGCRGDWGRRCRGRRGGCGLRFRGRHAGAARGLDARPVDGPHPRRGLGPAEGAADALEPRDPVVAADRDVVGVRKDRGRRHAPSPSRTCVRYESSSTRVRHRPVNARFIRRVRVVPRRRLLTRDPDARRSAARRTGARHGATLAVMPTSSQPFDPSARRPHPAPPPVTRRYDSV